jgi:hypothetical protein
VSSDITQAAERLRRYSNGASYISVYGDEWEDSEGIMKDRCILANAYLAEHQADDGELISEEWLKLEGYRQIEGDYEIAKCQNGCNAVVRMTNPPSAFISSYWMCITTRGQLRRLIEVLKHG